MSEEEGAVVEGVEKLTVVDDSEDENEHGAEDTSSEEEEESGEESAEAESYPLKVLYCGGELSAHFHDWLKENHEAMWNRLYGDGTATDDSTSKKKRGGKGKPKRRDVAAEPARIQRGKRKWITVINGLETYPGVKIGDVRKKFANKYATGVSLDSKSGALDIQGDVGEEILDFMEEALGIPKDLLTWLGDVKNANAARPKGNARPQQNGEKGKNKTHAAKARGKAGRK